MAPNFDELDFNTSLDKILDFILQNDGPDDSKIYTSLEDMKQDQEVFYLMGKDGFQILFLDDPLFQELNSLFTRSYEKNPQQTYDFAILWCQSDFISNIKTLSKVSITHQTLYNTTYVPAFKKVIKQGLFTKINPSIQKIDSLLDSFDNLIKTEEKIKDQSQSLVSTNSSQKKMEIDFQINQIKNLHEGLRHEIGLLLLFYDLIFMEGSIEYRNYINPSLGPDGGLYQYRKIWIEKTKRYEMQSEFKGLKEYFQTHPLTPKLSREIQSLLFSTKNYRTFASHKELEIELEKRSKDHQDPDYLIKEFENFFKKLIAPK